MDRTQSVSLLGHVARWLTVPVIAASLFTWQARVPGGAVAAPPAKTAVLGWEPGVARDVPLRGPLTVYFNRAMDHASVERAWTLSPPVAGTFAWSPTSVAFRPAHPLRSGASYRLSIGRGARSAAGPPLDTPFSVDFSTGDALRVVTYTPWTGTQGVPANGLIAITFNHPMVTLAGLSARPQNPPGWRLSISPSTAGHGSWLGTSTWVFRPARGLRPSTRYTVSLVRSAQDALGNSLGHDLRWSFRTITPEISSRSPGRGDQFADPHGPITVTFNQAMDPASTRSAFSVSAGGVRVPGTISWKGSTLVFHPLGMLDSARPYVVTVGASARSATQTATMGRRMQWQFRAAPAPKVASTDPGQGRTAYETQFCRYCFGPGPLQPGYGYGATIKFNEPMDKSSLDHHLSIAPPISQMDTYLYGPDDANVFPYGIYGSFKPSTAYTITISGGVRDSFGRAFPGFSYHFTTSRLSPSVALYGMPGATGISFTAGRVVNAPVQLINLPRVRYTLIRTTFPAVIHCCDRGQQPAGTRVRTWAVSTSNPLDKVRNMGVRLAKKDGSPLAPGLYWLEGTSSGVTPGLPPGAGSPISAEIIAATNVSITEKAGANGTLVWVTSAATGEPLSGVRVQLLGNEGGTLASGTTDANGLHTFKSVTNQSFASAMVTDSAHFGLSIPFWSPGQAPNDGIPPFWWLYQGQRGSNGGYIYTDRPIYRPGQRVRFRGVLWQDRDAVYSLFGRRQVDVVASDPNGRALLRTRLTLDKFGSVQGSFVLPRRTPTGTGTVGILMGNVTGSDTQFTVAEYRKPEFLTTVTSAQPAYAQGQTVKASIKVQYVFGAPVVHQQVIWTAYAQPQLSSPPGWESYSFFDWESLWQQTDLFNPPSQGQSVLGQTVAGGKGTTDGHGVMTITLPADLARDVLDRSLTIEATTTDINHQSVSGRVTVPEYKADLAIGLTAAHQVLPAGQPESVDVVTVRHDGTIVPNQQLAVTIARRTYASKLVDNTSTSSQGGTSWQAIPTDTTVETQTVATDAQGKARITFTPKDGGEYRVVVQGKDALGNTAGNALSVDASAEGFSDWGASENASIALQPDRATYGVGDTAHILVPAPFAKATALVTLERANVRKAWIVHLATNSSTVDVPITLSDLPNVYVTVTLYHGLQGNQPPDWRYGTAELHVRLDPRRLTIHLAQNGYRHHPGDRVTYTVTTTDMQGHPVASEVSLALVDTAVLALQDEVNPNIISALYAERPLEVSTASDGAVSIDHLQQTPDVPIQASTGYGYGAAAAPQAPKTGGGGGGGPPFITVRSKFADTALWNGSLVTDAKGRATISLTLPSNTTTWRLDARGVSGNQSVGQAQLQTLTTQDLIVRPVLPRFLVEGDSVHVGAVLNNNLAKAVDAMLSLSASGLSLSSGPARVHVPAHGERLVLWEGRVLQGTAAHFLFKAVPATSGVHGDAVRVSLPIQPPLTDETVATAGQVYGSMRQLVLLPHNAVPHPGALTVQVSSSMVAGVGAAFGELQPQPDESNEYVADRVLAAGSLRTLPASIAGLAPATYRRLPVIIAAGVQKLLDNQLLDGGWPWFNDPYAQSDPEITAVAIQALQAAGQHSALVRRAIAGGRRFLYNLLDSVSPGERTHLLLALAQTGTPPGKRAEAFYMNSVQRSQLGPGPLANLGMTLGIARDRARAISVVSSLDSRAFVSATGAHWEGTAWDYWSGPSVSTTTDVLATLVALSPHDPFVPAAVRWLMLARQGTAWDCPHDSAQAIAALAAYARAAREGTADYSYRVLVDGAGRLSGAYRTGSQSRVATATVPVRTLRRSGSSLQIERRAGDGTFGTGPLYYVTRLRYFLPARDIAARSEGLSVSRRYLDLHGHPVGSVSAGSAIQVELTIHTDQTLLYLDLEDPIPSGCEPIDSSLNTVQQGLFQAPVYDPFSPVHDLTPSIQHSDLHDNRVSLYAYSLPPGTYRYTYLAQATVPGQYGVPPTHAAETFFPEVFGRSAGQNFTVR